VSTSNFASLRGGPASKVENVTSFRVSAKDRTFAEEVYYKGWSFRQADWVHVSNPDDPTKPVMGQVFKCWISDEMYVSVHSMHMYL
jgi:chromatin structure-remodeling complex subunit RSC1/2